VGIEADEGGAGSYYAVSAVDSDGAESAQSLGISPASIASAGEEVAAVACFVNTVGKSMSIPGALVWVLVIFTIAVVVAHWKHGKKLKTEY
jgi:hypothetical protein